jgi:hypothetical protein
MNVVLSGRAATVRPDIVATGLESGGRPAAGYLSRPNLRRASNGIALIRLTFAQRFEYRFAAADDRSSRRLRQRDRSTDAIEPDAFRSIVLNLANAARVYSDQPRGSAAPMGGDIDHDRR